jgi:predicted dehydrogenase/threonine dehydrogenase-like Zn-dependent dehydrogenase
MKQVLQNLANGETELVNVPCPLNKEEHLLVATSKTLVSIGTERMLVEFGKANWIDKARQQPDKVRMVLNKAKTDGILPTYEAIKAKLDQPIALGYCNVGRVMESRVEGFQPGDRVVSNGNHAEVIRVPKNLSAKIPDEVDDESAAFTVLGAIALQGVRLVAPTIGETVVVTGLGLIGLIAVQLLRANGCRVLGIDFDSQKCALAQSFGAQTVDLSKGEDPLVSADTLSRGRGVHAVLITASTKSNEPVAQAANMCRKRGRIVLVGVVGLELSRADFYEKEISFQVSCSYGPGRYDSDYEIKGQDYPAGFVRWTEQRNFEAVLDLMASGKLDVRPLITHRYNIDLAIEAYEQLDNPKAMGIILEYPRHNETKELQLRRVPLHQEEMPVTASAVVCAFIGSGNYASRVLMPAFKDAGASLHTVVSSGGVSAVQYGKKNGFTEASTDFAAVCADKTINTIVIATRHDLHAKQVCDALAQGKHVFVEKPLALTHSDLDMIDAQYQSLQRKPHLMIGFNRRFSPLVVKMKELLQQRSEPKSFLITINAGKIPKEHWVQDPDVGGGRVIGEGCHFIDLMRFLAGSTIVKIQAQMIGAGPGIEVRDDKVSITLGFEDGSFGTIMYLANGGNSFAKERIEVFCADAVLQLDNFRILRGFGWSGFKKMRLFRQDKGQTQCVTHFITSILQGEPTPISYEEIIESSRATLEIAAVLKKNNQ